MSRYDFQLEACESRQFLSAAPMASMPSIVVQPIGGIIEPLMPLGGDPGVTDPNAGDPGTVDPINGDPAQNNDGSSTDGGIAGNGMPDTGGSTDTTGDGIGDGTPTGVLPVDSMGGPAVLSLGASRVNTTFTPHALHAHHAAHTHHVSHMRHLRHTK